MSEENIEMFHRHIIIIYYTRKTATGGSIDPTTVVWTATPLRDNSYPEQFSDGSKYFPI